MAAIWMSVSLGFLPALALGTLRNGKAFSRWGRVYDVWISFGSVHEVWAFRERKRRSLWFRKLVESCVVYGDRGYRGCEGVIVCGSREMRAKRQVVEGVISQIKLFNAGSGWRTLTCVLVYVYAYAIGYSYYRRGELEV